MMAWRALSLILTVAALGCSTDRSPFSQAEVEQRDLVLEVDVSGELVAPNSAQIGPPPVDRVWNFKIASMIDEGNEVKEGDVLLRFDTTELEQKLLQTTAERDTAIKTLEKRETDLRIEAENEQLALDESEARLRRARIAADVPEEVIATRELELARRDLELAEEEVGFRQQRIANLGRRAQSELQALRSKVARAESRVEDLQTKVGRMTVHSPRAGTVIFKRNWRGEKKKIGEQVWRMDKVMSIPDLSTLGARAEVDEAQAGRIAVGQTVRLQLDSHPERSYPARVKLIQSSVRQRSWRDPRKIVGLELEFDEVDLERMRPGMRFQGKIEIERIPGAVVVPLELVTPDPEGAFVWVRRGMGRSKVRPELGARNDTLVQILSGLEVGDVLLTQG